MTSIFERTKKHFGDLKELGTIDISSVKELIENTTTDEWNKDTLRQVLFRVHRHTQTLMVKWDSEEDKELFEKFGTFYEQLKQQVSEALNIKDPIVFKFCFARIPPGLGIDTHIDRQSHLRVPHRVHVPIITDDKVVSVIDGNSHFMKPGVIYNFNNTLQHSVKNNSPNARVHCIIDIQERSKVEELLGKDYERAMKKDNEHLRDIYKREVDQNL